MRKARAFVASGLLAIIAVAPAYAQSSPPDRSLMFSPKSVQQQTVAPQRPAQPSAVQAPATKRTDRKAAQPAVQQKRDASRVTPVTAAAKNPPQVNQPTLGRIPFETGTIGLTTNKQYNNTMFSDGRITPGFENVQRKDSSYFGLSLSVPTDRTSIPLPPLFARPD